MKSINKMLKLLKNIEREYNITLLSAGVSFFIIWAAIPSVYLIIQIVLASNILPIEQFISYVNTNLPSFLSKYIEAVLISSSTLDGFVLFTFIIFMLWGASKAFTGIMQSAELIYHEHMVRNAIITKIISLVITLGFVIMLILLIGLSFFTDDLIAQAITYFPYLRKVLTLTRFLAFPIILFILILLVLTFIVPRKVSFKGQIPGSIFITIAWTGFTSLFLVYIRDVANYQSMFGPFSSIIALFLWVFVLSYILLIGIMINSLIDKKKSLIGKK